MQPITWVKIRLGRAFQLRRALGLVWQSSKRLTIASFGLMIVEGLIPVLALFLTKSLVDQISLILAENPDNPDFASLTGTAALIGLTILTGVIVRQIAALTSDLQAQSVIDYVTGIIHRKSLEVDLAYYENPAYQNTLHLVQSDAPYRPKQIVDGLLHLTSSGTALVGIIILLGSLNPLILAALVLAVFPAVLVRFYFSRRYYRWRSEIAAVERRANYFTWLITSAYGAKEIRLFGLGEFLARNYDERRQTVRAGKLKLDYQRLRLMLPVEIFSAIIFLAVLLFLASRTLEGAITVGSFIIYLQAFQTGQNQLGAMLASLSSLYECQLFLQGFYEFLDLEPKVKEPAHPAPFPQPIRDGIRFENVSFHYPSNDTTVIEDLSLFIRAGETLAVVGENGAGKSTLVKLLCRLYDPDKGCITIDGVDIREFATADIRRAIGIVFQDYQEYQMSAWENIWLGDVSAPPNREAIVAAAKLAAADDLIRALPQGYDTQLGNWFETGHELSVGQWQRIALARAFLRNTPIVILDEPTSALDVMAEQEIYDRFHEITRGRIGIVISHRMSTVRMADHICVIDDHRLVEHGTHEALMEQNGIYAALFRTQAQRYQ